MARRSRHSAASRRSSRLARRPPQRRPPPRRRRPPRPPRRPHRRRPRRQRRPRWVARCTSAATTRTPAEKAGMDAINAAFKAATGIDVVINTVDHGTFQDQITNYLGGTPDTAYTWFSGFRMKFFADQGLNVAIDDVWDTVEEQLLRRASRARSSATTASSLRHPGRLLPVGGLLPEERLRGQGLHHPDDLGRAQDARDQDAGGRPDPDRLRRQGRLARHGHVRHPQPAPERLRLPRQPDGRQGEVDGPEGHRRRSRSGRRSSRSRPRTTPA